MTILAELIILGIGYTIARRIYRWGHKAGYQQAHLDQEELSRELVRVYGNLSTLDEKLRTDPIFIALVQAEERQREAAQERRQ